MNVLDHHISVSFDMAAWGRAYESVDPLLILDAKKISNRLRLFCLLAYLNCL